MTEKEIVEYISHYAFSEEDKKEGKKQFKAYIKKNGPSSLTIEEAFKMMTEISNPIATPTRKKLDKAMHGVICLQCSKILISYYNHDYKTCGCKNNTMIDGGQEYYRYGGVYMDRVQLVEVTPFKEKE